MKEYIGSISYDLRLINQHLNTKCPGNGFETVLWSCQCSQKPMLQYSNDSWWDGHNHFFGWFSFYYLLQQIYCILKYANIKWVGIIPPCQAFIFPSVHIPFGAIMIKQILGDLYTLDLTDIWYIFDLTNSNLSFVRYRCIWFKRRHRNQKELCSC